MTVRFVADENFDNDIVVGLQREVGDVDVELAQDVGLRTAEDPIVLQWAAEEGRIVLTHDISTMPDFAHERVAAGLPMPGVLVLSSKVSMGTAIQELALIATASDASEWADRVVYLPLR